MKVGNSKPTPQSKPALSVVGPAACIEVMVCKFVADADASDSVLALTLNAVGPTTLRTSINAKQSALILFTFDLYNINSTPICF